MTTKHKPEEIGALAEFCDEEAAELLMMASPKQNPYRDAAIALLAYAALLREREMEERLLDVGWTHIKEDMGLPAHRWSLGRTFIRNSDRAEAARLALAQMEDKP